MFSHPFQLLKREEHIFFKYHFKDEWGNWTLRALYSSQQPSWEFYQQCQLHIEGQSCIFHTVALSCSSLLRWEDGFLWGHWWGERRDQHSIGYPCACCRHDSPQKISLSLCASRQSHCLHKCFHRRPDDKYLVLRVISSVGTLPLCH